VEVKTKAKLLAEQSSAIIDIQANFKATVDSRKPYLEAKIVKKILLSNLKELEGLGIIDEEEFKIEAMKLIYLHV
jgi:DNA-binding HxlR family transcriptional regulator